MSNENLGAERSFYHRFAWAYDLLSARRGGPQIEDVATVFREHECAAGSHLVDAGCGTGAYAVALASLGFLITAVELSPELLATARHRARDSGATVTFAQADMTKGWAPARPADGVLCRGVLNDLLTDDSRERAFGAFASWLRPRGVLLLDVRETEHSRERYKNGRNFTRTATRGDDSLIFTSTTTMAANSDVLELLEQWQGIVAGERVGHQERFAMRTWSWGSVQDLADAAGFSAVSRLSGETVGARGDRIVAVAVL